MHDPDDRNEAFEAARDAADAAHDAVGDAEDELVDAARDQESGASGADARVARAERDWLDRQTDAETASRTRERARDDRNTS
jgi:hypothetical protein